MDFVDKEYLEGEYPGGLKSYEVIGILLDRDKIVATAVFRFDKTTDTGIISCTECQVGVRKMSDVFLTPEGTLVASAETLVTNFLSNVHTAISEGAWAEEQEIRSKDVALSALIGVGGDE